MDNEGEFIDLGVRGTTFKSVQYLRPFVISKLKYIAMCSVTPRAVST